MWAQTRTHKAEHPRRKGHEHEHHENPNKPTKAHMVDCSVRGDRGSKVQKLADKYRTASPPARPLDEVAAVAATNARQRVHIDPTMAYPWA